jgi:hypothetical protein
MPTPYGLVSTSQNLVEHQLTLTQPNQVIWYSLESKNVNDFMSFVRGQIRGATGRAFRAQIWNYIDDRNYLHAAALNTLRFGPNWSWPTRDWRAGISTLKRFFEFFLSRSVPSV